MTTTPTGVPPSSGLAYSGVGRTFPMTAAGVNGGGSRGGSGSGTPIASGSGSGAGLTLKDFLPFDIMDSDMFSVHYSSLLSQDQLVYAGITPEEQKSVFSQLKRQGIHEFMLAHASSSIPHLRRVLACFGVNPDSLKIQPSDFSAALYRPETITSQYPELLAEPSTENQIKSRLLTALSCTATKEWVPPPFPAFPFL
ncbi:hypothetical protein BT69DRAFT_992025 [Atractiella rhizophila]|nr:hypothetical protein BT69DRAFT_992025 [Atractiella rhizophila]